MIADTISNQKLDIKQIANRIYAGVFGVVTGTTTASYADNTIFIEPYAAGTGSSFQDHQSITHASTVYLQVLNIDSSVRLDVDLFEAPHPDAVWVDDTNNEYNRLRGLTGATGLNAGEKFAFRDLSFGVKYAVILKDGTGPGTGANYKVTWVFKG